MRLASNYRWSWDSSTRELLAALPGAAPGTHPVEVVETLSPGHLDRLLRDGEFVAAVTGALGELDRLEVPDQDPVIAYCSPEFGIAAELHQYAGGLGVLSGDHLKAASDRGLPLVGVGLFYRQGAFRQAIEHGHQTDHHVSTDPHAVGARDTGITVEVPFPGREVSARVWSLAVGATPLLLLDTDLEANNEHDRRITDRLYEGSKQHRIDQEMILGIGGARALAAMDWDIGVYHLNEGHAGFIALEMIDRVIEDGDLATALTKVRDGLVFTTHTPVPAGIDRFQHEVIAPYLDLWSDRWGIPIETLWKIGEDPDDPHRFNMAVWCLRISRAANGVSRLHGEVSRSMFTGIGVGDEIGSVTNGVHARTWTAPHIQEVFDDVLGPEWASGSADSWARIDEIDDETLQSLRRTGSARLAALVADRTGQVLHPEALVIGFARRMARYKRATLVLGDRERLEALLADDERPVHFVFSGKAHPYDEPGKGMVAELIEFAWSENARGRFTFIPDYDMEVAYVLVQGCDVWLNNPIHPREASGTSGEKVALNGGLNCSILDGWFAEMFDGENGWAIPVSGNPDAGLRDYEEAVALLTTISGVVDEYYDDPAAFQNRIRHAWRTLGPQVTAARMLEDYVQRVYRPAM